MIDYLRKSNNLQEILKLVKLKHNDNIMDGTGEHYAK